MARRKRELPKTGRRGPGRRPKRRVLIVCGGKVTEKEYFDFARGKLGASATKVVAPGEGKDPVGLVSYAKRFLASARRDADYEEVWAVTDVDEFENLEEAQKLAAESGIKLVISNPCFEVWLIDHFEQCSCTTTAVCEQRARDLGVVSRKGKGGSGAKKAKHVETQKLDGALEVAMANAKRHNTEEKGEIRSRNAGKTSGYVIWTDVPLVIESMRSGGFPSSFDG